MVATPNPIQWQHQVEVQEKARPFWTETVRCDSRMLEQRYLCKLAYHDFPVRQQKALCVQEPHYALRKSVPALD